jgi:hypothetical protein
VSRPPSTKNAWPTAGGGLDERCFGPVALHAKLVGHFVYWSIGFDPTEASDEQRG